MSLESTEKVVCPKCGQVTDFQMWSSINTMIDPDMKEKVRSREAFMFTCPECGERTLVEYDFLYHQMEDKIMLYYASQNPEKVLEEVESFAASPMFNEAEGYKIRVVTSRREFEEKLVIWENGYDDRVVEIFKLVMYALLMDENPDLEIGRMYFIVDNDVQKFFLELADDEVATVDFERKMYEEIQKNFEEKLKGNKDFVIDFVWADEMLRGK